MTSSQSGKLTASQKAAFEEQLRKHSKGHIVCPVCNNADWSFNEHLSEMRTFQYGAINLGAGIVPVVVATCRVCSHILLFNALSAGLVDTGEGEVDDE